jgi:hypothetical protein
VEQLLLGSVMGRNVSKCKNDKRKERKKVLLVRAQIRTYYLRMKEL